jgi:hypothetical protein
MGCRKPECAVTDPDHKFYQRLPDGDFTEDVLNFCSYAASAKENSAALVQGFGPGSSQSGNERLYYMVNGPAGAEGDYYCAAAMNRDSKSTDPEGKQLSDNEIMIERIISAV